MFCIVTLGATVHYTNLLATATLPDATTAAAAVAAVAAGSLSKLNPASTAGDSVGLTYPA